LIDYKYDREKKLENVYIDTKDNTCRVEGNATNFLVCEYTPDKKAQYFWQKDAPAQVEITSH
jgi:hypothetical protein